jgi:hypothetical protein
MYNCANSKCGKPHDNVYSKFCSTYCVYEWATDEEIRISKLIQESKQIAKPNQRKPEIPILNVQRGARH